MPEPTSRSLEQIEELIDQLQQRDLTVWHIVTTYATMAAVLLVLVAGLDETWTINLLWIFGVSSFLIHSTIFYHERK